MGNFLTELSTLVLNGVSPAQYTAAFMMATFGGILSLYVSAQKRKTENGENPVPFSKTYLLLNNLQRITGSIMITFAMIRFVNSAFDPNVTIAMAFGLGYSSDLAMNVLRKIEAKADVVKEVVGDKSEPETSN